MLAFVTVDATLAKVSENINVAGWSRQRGDVIAHLDGYRLNLLPLPAHPLLR